MANIKLVLASKSPRRQQLIQELGIPFEIRIKEVEEVYPDDLDLDKVPIYLAELKAKPLLESIQENEILLTSDTIVIHNGKILGKPKNNDDAIRMLKELSGSRHEVVTGVSLCSRSKSITFSTKTTVSFSTLSSEEIEHYVKKYKPLDKAGSYGIQEWIGYIGVEKIEGCYYNVMGLPVHDVYTNLKKEFF